MNIPLTKPVGKLAKKEEGNLPAEVGLVKRRLRQLGFDGFSHTNECDGALIASIGLVDANTNARTTIVIREPKPKPPKPPVQRIDVGSALHRWLEAANAPRWRMLPVGHKSLGFVNIEVRDELKDGHDFGTNWLTSTIRAAGRNYVKDFLSQNPGRAAINVNDASLVRGGNTPDHEGHETGICIDVRLPRKTVNADGTVAGKLTYLDKKEYDREAARAQIKAFLATSPAVRVFFNDPILIKEKLCASSPKHDNHYHVELEKPPGILLEDATLGGDLDQLVPEVLEKLWALGTTVKRKITVTAGWRLGTAGASPHHTGIGADIAIEGLKSVAIADELVNAGFTGVGEHWVDDATEDSDAHGDIRGLPGADDSGPYAAGMGMASPVCWYRVSPQGKDVVGQRKSGHPCPGA